MRFKKINIEKLPQKKVVFAEIRDRAEGAILFIKREAHPFIEDVRKLDTPELVDLIEGVYDSDNDLALVLDKIVPAMEFKIGTIAKWSAEPLPSGDVKVSAVIRR